jgi:hypothetical protein
MKIENTQLIHIITEVVIVIGLVVYVSRNQKKTLGHIKDVVQRLEEQDELIHKQEKQINELTSNISMLMGEVEKLQNILGPLLQKCPVLNKSIQISQQIPSQQTPSQQISSQQHETLTQSVAQTVSQSPQVQKQKLQPKLQPKFQEVHQQVHQQVHQEVHQQVQPKHPHIVVSEPMQEFSTQTFVVKETGFMNVFDPKMLSKFPFPFNTGSDTKSDTKSDNECGKVEEIIDENIGDSEEKEEDEDALLDNEIREELDEILSHEKIE